MTGKIFVNDRRGDDPGYTQALYQRLEDEFTSDNLFMDVEGHIRPGDDFVEVLSAQVTAADVLLVVIGPRWASLLAERQGDPDDFVAIEIRAGLEQHKRVIPVLVGGADMPRADTLPEPIRALARRNAVGLRPERFRADCQGLITALTEQLAAAERERAAKTDAERAAAEAERQNREAEEAARIAAAEERAKAQAVEGLSPEEIRKAEELANWDFITERDEPQALRDHLARFPGGVTALYAQTRLEALIWAGLGASPNIATLQDFLDEFPKGAHADAARTKLTHLRAQAEASHQAEQQRLQETEEWGAVAASGEPGPINAFLAKWPQGQHAAAARARIAELRRGKGGVRRGILIGAGATVGLAALVIGGRLGYHKLRLLPTYWDVSRSVLTAQAEQALKSGSTFKECGSCPQMVVVPAGRFTMGSPANENNRDKDEGPQHRVTIRNPFAVGKFEITFDQWDACVAHGGCTHEPADEFWGRGSRPVINVSWDDAKQYVGWISKLTGKPYRLLTEAEWEYAARAGSTTVYSWGDDVGKGNANCDGCGSQWDNKQSAPVGSFKPNAFGLHDMHGNVWEWTEDCYKDSYAGAPTDGSSVSVQNCNARVLRGGSWDSLPRDLRAAGRLGHLADDRGNLGGFRVGRALFPARTP